MREAQIETQVCSVARRRGWLVFKWVSPNNRGVPDRIFIKDGRVIFVEFKATGKKPTKLQALVHRRLEGEGFRVRVIDSIETGVALFT